MRTIGLVLLVTLVVLLGCAPPAPPLAVTLATPADGSTVTSVSPALSWTSTGGASAYRLQVASDSNFQELVVDANTLTDVIYTVPSGKLTHDKTYYWRVGAYRGTQTSGWSSAWSFRTTDRTPPPPPPSGKGTIQVSVTLDGAPWSGGINYRITGPSVFTGISAPQSFVDMPSGDYTITYNFAGPSGATLANVTPSPSQTLTVGGALYFTLNFHRPLNCSIQVFALLDGAPWSGSVNYSITGPFSDSEYSVPKTLTNLPTGTYTLTYTSGGPPGAVLTSIAPGATEILGPGMNTSFTLNFYTSLTGNIAVNATLNGAPWSGPVNYTITGPFNDSEYSVPKTLSSLPPGNYTLIYTVGGPPGATLASIIPSPMQTLAGGRTIVFNLNFVAQQASGTIMVNATLDGASWQTAIGSGPISYTIVGPKTDSSSSIPYTFNNQPAGAYTLSYNSGGPVGATLTAITPAPTQTLAPGGTIVFTLNFHGQAKGTVMVNATLNDAPWSGSVGYVVHGPYTESGYAAPQSFPNAPTGNYSVTYSFGGPPSSVFEGVIPPTQVLSPGGTITFMLSFRFQGVTPPMPGPVPRVTE